MSLILKLFSFYASIKKIIHRNLSAKSTKLLTFSLCWCKKIDKGSCQYWDWWRPMDFTHHQKLLHQPEFCYCLKKLFFALRNQLTLYSSTPMLSVRIILPIKYSLSLWHCIYRRIFYFWNVILISSKEWKNRILQK